MWCKQKEVSLFYAKLFNLLKTSLQMSKNMLPLSVKLLFDYDVNPKIFCHLYYLHRVRWQKKLRLLFPKSLCGTWR